MSEETEQFDYQSLAGEPVPPRGGVSPNDETLAAFYEDTREWFGVERPTPAT